MVTRKDSKVVRISDTAYDMQTKFMREFGVDRSELIEAMTYALLGGASIKPGNKLGVRWWGFRMVRGAGIEPVPEYFTAESLHELSHALELGQCKCTQY